MATLVRKLMGAGIPAGTANVLLGDVQDSMTASGTSQSDAQTIGAAITRFTTVASGSGGILPAGAIGDELLIINAGANALSLYPPVGHAINAGSTNAAFSVASTGSVVIKRVSNLLWIALDASQLQFIQSGSGATSRTAQAKMREIVSVLDFGATGDGTTDDRTAINNALTAGYAVYFPRASSKYLVSAGLTATTAKKVYGDNAYLSLIECSDNTADILTFPDDADFVHVADIGLQYATKGTGDGLVFTNSNNNLTVDRVYVAKADIGFNSKNVTFLQTYNGCRANECNTGFSAEGRAADLSGGGTALIYNQCYTNLCNTGFAPTAIRDVIFNQPTIQFDANSTAPTGILATLCTLVKVNGITFEGTLGASGGYGVRAVSSTLDILSIDGAAVQLTATGFDWYLYSVSNATGTTKVEVKNVSGRLATDCKEYLMQNDAGGVIVLNKFNNDFGTEINGTSTGSVSGEFIERDFDRGVKATVVELFDDFLGDALADQWNATVGTDPQCSAFAVRAGQANGFIRGVTGDAGTGMAADGIQLDSDLNYRPNQGGLVMEFRISLPSITFESVFVGFTDQVASLEMPIHSAASGDTLTTNATDAVGVMFDTSMDTDNWWLVGVANDVDATAQNTAVAPSAATAETWRIEVSKAGTATFYRNGTQIGTAMTGAVTATAALTPVVAAFARAAASRNVDLDYIMVQNKR